MFLSAVIALSALGLIFGLGLAFASLKLAVDEDPNLKKILDVLPGLNCGACGKAGCSAFAEGVLHHQVSANGCLPGGEKVATEIGKIIGVQATDAIVKKAVIHCGTSFANRTRIADYQGIQSCSGAILLQGAGFACPYSCLGFGDCQKACPFHAIEVRNGKPVVIHGKCTGCGLCVKACPRNIITLEILSKDKELCVVECRSFAKGALVREVCAVGCIGCKLCERNIPDVFKVENNLAKVYYEKSDEITDWEKAIKVCPQHTIKQVLSKDEVNKLLSQ